jgi:hypothetical protein
MDIARAGARRHSIVVLCASALLLRAAPPRAEEPPAQTRFASAAAAFDALVSAARTNDRARLDAILGRDGAAILSSGDEVEDADDRRRFVTAAAERTRFETLPDGAVIAYLGRRRTPFAIPMVRDGDQWRFDTAAGKDELLNRRVGRNELLTIAAMRAFVDAQEEYARREPGAGESRVYAQKIRSTAGQHDGLYWDDPDGTDPSPLGPLFAAAAGEGYELGSVPATPQPFRGYLFRILTEQGKNAPGGARSYLHDGKLTGGYALIAWPAEYGRSGVMTFLVNESGVVFQKDLGPQTADAVKAITAYEPDASWTPTR